MSGALLLMVALMALATLKLKKFWSLAPQANLVSL
jgi:hypothetical protein